MGLDVIELHELRCFVALAEELDPRRAAERLQVEVPALTRAVEALQEKVGARLLADSRRFEPTEAGARFLAGAHDVLAALDSAVEAALGARSANGGRPAARPERHLRIVDARLDALESTLLELVSAFGMLASELALRSDLRLSTPHEVKKALERGWRSLVEESVLVSPLALPQEAAGALREAMDKTGAAVGAIYELPEGGRELLLLAAEGYPSEVMEQFLRVPLDADMPAAEAARSGRPLWFREREEILEDYPGLRLAHERTEAAIGRRGDQGAVIPVTADERVVAVLVIGFAPDALTLRSV